MTTGENDMIKPVNSLRITITGEQGHGKTRALEAIVDALKPLGFQVLSRDDGDIGWCLRGMGIDKDAPFFGVVRIETQYPDE
jgi:hypothetical protein